MAWQYHDFEEQTTASAKLARLVLHISEVREEIGPNTSRAGISRDNDNLVTYLSTLESRRSQLNREARSSSMFTRGRPI